LANLATRKFKNCFILSIKMGFVCKNCNFRTNKNPRVCSYCGREDSVEEERDASGLIEDIDRLLYG
jgi:predicted ATP-dependent serine protease|tara:strand:+ start:771 stop:968 length:198 start_codon:yes stop_codon:yes gene_type:complete